MLSLRKSILVSAGFHVGVFSAFFILSSPGGARIIYKPQYQVRLVEPSEVPSLRPKKKSKPAPKPRKPPRPKPPPEKKVSLPEKKEAKPEVRKDPPKPPEPLKKKTPVAQAKEPEHPDPTLEPVDPQQEKALEDVLARLQKDAETLEKSGSKRSAEKEASGWEQRRKEIRYHQYYDQVEQRVRENWIPPKNMEQNRRDVMTVVSIALLPDGRVLESFIEESSGDPLFDQSVMRALLKSAPLPPPPMGLRQGRYELGLRFHSQPRVR